VVLPGMHKITARRKELLAVKMKGGLNPVRKTSTLFDENNGRISYPLIINFLLRLFPLTSLTVIDTQIT